MKSIYTTKSKKDPPVTGPPSPIIPGTNMSPYFKEKKINAPYNPIAPQTLPIDNVDNKIQILPTQQKLQFNAINNRKPDILKQDKSAPKPVKLTPFDGNAILEKYQEAGGIITKREDFNPWWNWASRKAGDVDNRQDSFGTLGDLYAYYAGQPLHYNTLEFSQYKPTTSKNPNAKYIAINDPKFKQEVYDKYVDVFLNKDLQEQERWSIPGSRLYKINDSTYSVSGYEFPTAEHWRQSKLLNKKVHLISGKDHVSNAIGRYFLSKGKDDKGDYISYYDIFDVHSGSEKRNLGETLGLTKPFEIYDRIYLDPKTGKPINKQEYGKGGLFKDPPVNGKKKGNPILDWWYNLDDVQGTYKMYNDLDPFLKNWFSHPETQKRLKENLQDNVLTRSINPKNLTDKSINLLEKTPIFSRKLVNKSGVSQSDIEYNNELQGWKTPYTYGSSPYFSGLNKGVYIPRVKQIMVNSFEDPETVVHEGVHAAEPWQDAMENVINYKYLNKKNPDERFREYYGISNYDADKNQFVTEPFELVKKRYPNIYTVFKDDLEYLNKDGMYPRIMEIRRNLNLKPGQIIDKSILKNESIHSPLNDLRHYYDDDTIIDMLNKIAKNKFTNKLMYANEGGVFKDNRVMQSGGIFKKKNNNSITPIKNVFFKGGLMDEDPPVNPIPSPVPSGVNVFATTPNSAYKLSYNPLTPQTFSSSSTNVVKQKLPTKEELAKNQLLKSLENRDKIYATKGPEKDRKLTPREQKVLELEMEAQTLGQSIVTTNQFGEPVIKWDPTQPKASGRIEPEYMDPITMGVLFGTGAYGLGYGLAASLGIAADNALFNLPSLGKGIGKLALKNVPKPTSISSFVDNVGRGFKSEIDWGKWNKEIPENKALMQEYNAIEQQAKNTGTWMKNPDGSPFQGTPEQFVQQNSKNFKKAFPNVLRDEVGNVQKTYHGSQDKFESFDPNITRVGRTKGQGIYTSPIKERAATYADKGEKQLYEFYQNANKKQTLIEDFNALSQKRFDDFLKKNPKSSKDFNKKFKDFMEQEDLIYNKEVTDDMFKLQKGYDFYKASPDEYVVPFTNYPKSAVGNNGMFDMTNPNIYKALVPIVMGAGALQQNKQEYGKGGLFKKKGGQMIKRADGSYSQRGLWDNIRANKGSGKKPTKQMLEQERKIKNK
jgi:hypothetical protein